MSGFKFAEEFCRGPDPTFAGVFEALSNPFVGVGLRCDIEQTLICLRVLDDRSSFAVDRQDDWPLALLDLFQELGGLSSKGGEWLNVGGDVERGQSIAPLKVLRCHSLSSVHGPTALIL